MVTKCFKNQILHEIYDMKYNNDDTNADIKTCGKKRCLPCCDNDFKPI